MKLADFSYHLPKTHVAKQPAVPRDSSKLLVLNKNTGEIRDSVFSDLALYLQPGDVLVRNNTKVIPARLFGTKQTGGKVEVLLVKKIVTPADDHTEVWECITRPGLKVGQRITFHSPTLHSSHVAKLSAACVRATEGKKYTLLLSFNLTGESFLAELENIGSTPLPPYIADETADSATIRKQYQTTYAKHEGSVAAPTAGLHFTPELEAKLTARGVITTEVTLHVGLGTFLPVKTEQITDHTMHAEWFEVRPEAAAIITQAKRAGRRVIAIGTTSARVLESAASTNTTQKEFLLEPQTGETSIYIYPGYTYRCVDGLITNFHLPESTLLMLVSALTSKPNTNQVFTTFLENIVGKAYLHAIEKEYRFFSFGDGMLITP